MKTEIHWLIWEPFSLWCSSTQRSSCYWLFCGTYTNVWPDSLSANSNQRWDTLEPFIRLCSSKRFWWYSLKHTWKFCFLPWWTYGVSLQIQIAIHSILLSPSWLSLLWCWSFQSLYAMLYSNLKQIPTTKNSIDNGESFLKTIDRIPDQLFPTSFGSAWEESFSLVQYSKCEIKATSRSKFSSTST